MLDVVIYGLVFIGVVVGVLVLGVPWIRRGEIRGAESTVDE